MNPNPVDDELDKILEILHNSWIEDDYDSSDPHAVEAKQAIMTYVERSNRLAATQELLDEAIRNRDGLPKVWPGLGKWMYEFFNARVDTLQRELADAKKGILW